MEVPDISAAHLSQSGVARMARFDVRSGSLTRSVDRLIWHSNAV
jgi:hypothetical protein